MGLQASLDTGLRLIWCFWLWGNSYRTHLGANLPEQEKTITWDMLNLCIGSIFEVMQERIQFNTEDVARQLEKNGAHVLRQVTTKTDETSVF